MPCSIPVQGQAFVLEIKFLHAHKVLNFSLERAIRSRVTRYFGRRELFSLLLPTTGRGSAACA